MADPIHDQAEDGFHEIQLSGKQLVFLFMATTVISVIIFICGVLVGRRVAAQDLGREAGTAVASERAPDEPAAPQVDAAPTPVPDTPPRYQDHLEASQLRTEPLKPQAEPPAPPPQQEAPRDTAPALAASPTQEKPAPEPAPTATSGARPGVWAVQVMSLRDRSAAMQLVQRLKGKGYPAYLVPPASGAPSPLYKVQVGRYRDRTEAQQADAKLKKEEQFQTWIVR